MKPMMVSYIHNRVFQAFWVFHAPNVRGLAKHLSVCEVFQGVLYLRASPALKPVTRAFDQRCVRAVAPR